jgi:hypothetical protein
MLIHHLRDEQQARWWPQIRDVGSLHRRDHHHLHQTDYWKDLSNLNWKSVLNMIPVTMSTFSNSVLQRKVVYRGNKYLGTLTIQINVIPVIYISSEHHNLHSTLTLMQPLLKQF